MAYAKLDDQFHSHPKIQRAGRHANAVAGLYARALSYCGAHLTDGFIEGWWAEQTGDKKLRTMLTALGLWDEVDQGEERTITDRKDSGRRRRADVTIVFPADGYFIADYVHFNPSRAEVQEARKPSAPESANARATESATDAHLRAQNGAHSSPVQSRDLLSNASAVRARPGALERLLEVLHDADEGTPAVISKLALEHRLAEGDLEYARECALGPNVRHRTKVAVNALKQRARERSSA